jgi:hypothetical protein
MGLKCLEPECSFEAKPGTNYCYVHAPRGVRVVLGFGGREDNSVADTTIPIGSQVSIPGRDEDKDGEA